MLVEATGSFYALLAMFGLVIGLVYSVVGAAGGILSTVVLISIIGITDPNMVKPMAQILTIASPLISIPSYYQQARIVFILGILLGVGGIIGAIIGSTFSTYYLSDLNDFKFLFGLFTLYIAFYMLWSVIKNRIQSKKRHNIQERATRFYKNAVAKNVDEYSVGVQNHSMSWSLIRFKFGNQYFQFAPWLAVFAGFIIALISSSLGVGGGFLLVPFMATIMRLPMFVIAATSAMAIIVSSTSSVANYLYLGASIDIAVIIYLLIGTVIGSFIGPKISRYFNETYLKYFLSMILFLIGLKYLYF